MNSILAPLLKGASYQCRHCGADISYTFEECGYTWTVPAFGSCGCEESRRELQTNEVSADFKNDRYELAGIPRMYRKGGEVKQRWVKQIMQGRNETLDGSPVKNGIFFHGANMTGKTTAACAIAREFVDKGWTVKFESVVSLLTKLRGEFDGHKTNAMLNAIGCDLLVLDDIGQELPTGWARGVLYEIVNTRYANMLPTVYTSNFTLGQLAKAMGDDANTRAIASRIALTTVAERMER